jgi:hypothetical protein
MENLTGKDTSEFYEMNEQQVRDNVKSARAYDFVETDKNTWNVRYFKRKYGSKKSPFTTGHIYVLQNTSVPGIFKIGFTERSVVDRVNEINKATGVITPWQIRDFWFTQEPYLAEQEIHRQLSDYRVQDNREGFAVKFSVARDVIFEVLGIPNDDLT